MLDAKWVVQIYAYDNNGNAYIGTGYAIDDWHILTASHVLFLDERKDKLKFKLVWSEKETNGELTINNKKPVYSSSEMYFSEKDIIFNSDKNEYDLAVIRCPIKPPITPPKAILANNINNKNGWETKGFPRLVRQEDKRHLIGFDVKYQSQDSFVLTIDTSLKPNEEKFNENEKIWGGLSGAPVFSGNELIAVITNDNDSVKNYFYATSIPWVKEYCPEFCEKIKPHIDQETEEKYKQELNNKINLAIKPMLKNWSAIEELKSVLSLDDDKKLDDIADYLVDMDVLKSITALTKSLKEYKELSNPDPKKWEECIKRAGKIAGWLLIKTVNLTWCLNNEQLIKKNIAGEFFLDNPDYIEVIISRSFLQSAEYLLDIGESGTGKVKPIAKKIPFLAYDSNQIAFDEQWLIILYRDFHGEQTKFTAKDPNKFADEILKSIKDRVIELFDVRGKVIYYLIDSDKLKLLKSTSWFAKAQEYLSGYVQFICCIQKIQSDQEHSIEDQTRLLEKLAILLNMINEK